MEIKLENKKKSVFSKALDSIERIGNKMPDAFIIFVWLCAILVMLSVALSVLNVSAVHPSTGEILEVKSLLSPEMIIKLLTNLVSNFVNFAPLGAVLVCMLGIGLCDKSGLLKVALTSGLGKVKGSYLKVIVLLIFLSIIFSASGDAAFIIMPPLGAMIFASIGRNPLAGMMLAYASVAGAFGGNIMPTVLDVLLVGFTGSAVGISGIEATVNPVMTYYFQATSVFVVIIVATWVTIKLIEPRLGKIENYEIDHIEEVTDIQRKGMKWALISLFVFVGIILLVTVPKTGFLRDPETRQIISLKSPFMGSLVVLVTLAFFIPGLVYGKITGTISNGNKFVSVLNQSMSEMGSFVVLTFILAQFTSLFNWSNLGIVLAINGANAIKALGLPIPVLMVLLILFICAIDIFLGSASAKWAILAPIFVPMFMFLGLHPALTQMVYRIGDAVINASSPLSAYFIMLLATGKKYDKNMGLGTLMATMLQYSFFYLIAWIIQLLIWYFLKLPLGPGGPLMM